MSSTNVIMKENSNTEVNSVKSPRTTTAPVKPRIPFSGAVKLSGSNTQKTTPGTKNSIGTKEPTKTLTKTSTQTTKSSSPNKVSPITSKSTRVKNNTNDPTRRTSNGLNISNPRVPQVVPKVSSSKSLANESSPKASTTIKSPTITPRKTHRSTKSMPPRINTTNASNNNSPPSPIKKRRPSQPELTQNPTSFKSPIDLSHVKSRVGSLDNISYTPKSASNGEKKKVFSKKADYSNVKSRVGSLDNIKYTPKGGGTSKRVSSSNSSDIEFSSASSTSDISSRNDPKIDNVKSSINRDNNNEKNKGGDVKIFSKKPKFTSVQSKVSSRENINFVPKRKSNPQVFTSKLDLKNVKSRVGSLDNIKYVPGGGDVVIYSEKLKFREKATPKIDAGVSKNSADNTSFLEDDRLNAILSPSPISSIASEDVPEINSPPEELMIPTPFRVALSPIAEILQSSQEEDESEYQQSIAQLISHSDASQISPDIENKTAVVKGKPAPISEEKFDKPVDSITTIEEPQQPSSSSTIKRETPQSIKAKIAALEAKNAEIAARKLAAKEKLKAAAFATKTKAVNDDEENYRDFVQKFQQEFECPQDDADIIYAINNEEDSDLNFEVNVLRKSRLLSESNNREVESLYIPEIPPLAIQVPPEGNQIPVVPELTLAQKRAYDSSWI
ncbi:3852_t:CDS:2 [Ambispora leptoticha]|uniref:3852_t:CDS:1 n=1 Tax=Ambispora leptoticha TaxID=144679 RepID=A0A9N9C2D0_9GLOM|nr:3852_t:CDS:2 [Ambispora leptoticha]